MIVHDISGRMQSHQKWMERSRAYDGHCAARRALQARGVRETDYGRSGSTAPMTCSSRRSTCRPRATRAVVVFSLHFWVRRTAACRAAPTSWSVRRAPTPGDGCRITVGAWRCFTRRRSRRARTNLSVPGSAPGRGGTVRPNAAGRFLPVGRSGRGSRHGVLPVRVRVWVDLVRAGDLSRRTVDGRRGEPAGHHGALGPGHPLCVRRLRGPGLRRNSAPHDPLRWPTGRPAAGAADGTEVGRDPTRPPRETACRPCPTTTPSLPVSPTDESDRTTIAGADFESLSCAGLAGPARSGVDRELRGRH